MSYTVIASNFEPDMLGEYKLTFESDTPLAVEEIKPEGFGLKMHEIHVPQNSICRDLGAA